MEWFKISEDWYYSNRPKRPLTVIDHEGIGWCWSTDDGPNNKRHGPFPTAQECMDAADAAWPTLE